jgi:hypothetical protein
MLPIEKSLDLVKVLSQKIKFIFLVEEKRSGSFIKMGARIRQCNFSRW